MLGAGRVALCAAALLSIASDAALAGSHRSTILFLLCAYGLFGVLALMAASPRRSHAWPAGLTQAIDFAAAAALTIASSGPGANPFFLFFLFTLLGAAYRWGLRETLITASAGVLVLTGPAVVLGSPDMQHVLMRSTYLMIAGVLLGWLAESELQRRAEVAVVSDALSRLQRQTTVHRAMREVCSDVMTLFGAEQLLVAVQEPGSGSSHLWSAGVDRSRVQIRIREIAPEERAVYFFNAPLEAWEATRDGAGRQLAAVVAEDGRCLGSRRCDIPPAIWGDSRATTVAGIDVGFAGQWSGRVLMLARHRIGPADLAFFQELICQLAPAMFSLYLLRRLHARVSAAERARVARELHDGLIQTLAGLRFDVAALRRHAERGVPLDAELARLEQVLAEQVVATRELMHRIRPVDVTPRQLPAYLGSIVERFTRETGIPAYYHTDVEGTDLPPRTCRELVRTLEEALVNVRKHSAARQVVVRFSADPIHYRLTIDNDGRPFEFAGRLTLAELEAARRGPLVIKERVREMGGELVIESSPGRGVRMDVLLRRRQRAGSWKTA